MYTHKHIRYTLQHTEPEKDTAEPEGPVLLDSSKTIQHGFMQNKYMSLPAPSWHFRGIKGIPQNILHGERLGS